MALRIADSLRNPQLLLRLLENDFSAHDRHQYAGIANRLWRHAGDVAIDENQIGKLPSLDGSLDAFLE